VEDAWHCCRFDFIIGWHSVEEAKQVDVKVIVSNKRFLEYCHTVNGYSHTLYSSLNSSIDVMSISLRFYILRYKLEVNTHATTIAQPPTIIE
jgi:hypothetical protein